MTPAEYTKAARKFDTHPPVYQGIASAFGLAAEAGEVANEMERAHRLRPDIDAIQGLDTKKFKAELGDVLWHMSRLLDTYGWSFEELMQENIDKLTERYDREGIRTD